MRIVDRIKIHADEASFILMPRQHYIEAKFKQFFYDGVKGISYQRIKDSINRINRQSLGLVSNTPPDEIDDNIALDIKWEA